MVAADSWSGIYQGEISQMDDNYLLQTVGEDFVIHDRLLLQPDYSIGQARSISYFEGVN